MKIAKRLFHTQTGTMFVDFYQFLQEIPRWHMMAAAISGYMIYYLAEVVKRPYLAAREGPFKEFLKRKVPTIDTRYWPTFWCVESRAQTVFASILRSSTLPFMNYKREILTLKDGGEVALDWMEDNCKADAPIIVILPGLTGASQAEYIKCLVMSANFAGIRAVVFNNRGLGLPLKVSSLLCSY